MIFKLVQSLYLKFKRKKLDKNKFNPKNQTYFFFSIFLIIFLCFQLINIFLSLHRICFVLLLILPGIVLGITYLLWSNLSNPYNHNNKLLLNNSHQWVNVGVNQLNL